MPVKVLANDPINFRLCSLLYEIICLSWIAEEIFTAFDQRHLNDK